MKDQRFLEQDQEEKGFYIKSCIPAKAGIYNLPNDI